MQNASIPQIAVYSKLSLDADFLKNVKDFNEIQNKLILLSQGRNLIIDDFLDFNIPTLLKIFDTVKKYASEIIYENKDGLKFLICSRHFEDDFIESQDVVNILAIIDVENNKTSLGDLEKTLDITKIWESKKVNDYIAHVRECLKQILAMTHDAFSITFVGTYPKEVFLLAYYVLSKNKSIALFYKPDADAKVMRIK